MARMLELEGYLAQVANSGGQALSLLQRNRYDLLLLDMHMPGLPGLEVLQQAGQMGLDLAVVILTGHKEFEDSVAALSSELVTDFLLKPASNHEIISAVARALQKAATHPLS